MNFFFFKIELLSALCGFARDMVFQIILWDFVALILRPTCPQQLWGERSEWGKKFFFGKPELNTMGD